MSFDNIPQELKDLKQWLCWKLEDSDIGRPTKVPYDAKTGLHASITNPFTWCDYNTAANSVKMGNYSGIGFVFTRNDPYAGIDLDDAGEDATAHDRQLKVYTEFNSYSERSPSGKGLHIIIKGNVKHGRRRSKIEVYSSERFFTMTGDVYKDAPIAERQTLLDILWEQMGNGSKIAIYDKDYNGPETISDDEIRRKAAEATNRDKFSTLLQGDWTTLYSSQSEADLALINILAFYTQNREQITRIFRGSKLGIRDKAWRDDYIKYNIDKSFDMMLPPIDLDTLSNNLAEAWANTKITSSGTSRVPEERSTLEAIKSEGNSATPYIPNQKTKSIYPPGLVGEIAEFIEAQAPRPVPEIALAGAIALMSGVCGRSYNISGTGLNSYTMLLANTGRGKEAAKSGISKLLAATIDKVPHINEYLGPSQIASMQALQRTLADNPCFVTIQGEIGLKLQQFASVRAQSNDILLKALLLDLYNKSGETDVLQGSVYADKANNVPSVQSPAFSWFGESTPETFYAALNEGLIADGLIPRFSIIEYRGKRVPMNYEAEFVKPSFALIDKFGDLCAKSKEMFASRKVIIVKQDEQSEKLLKEFNEHIDTLIDNQKDVVVDLWNRSHLKALKLAALVAVGINPYLPTITYDIAHWSIDQVYKQTVNLVNRFTEGDMIGDNLVNDDAKQTKDLLRVIGKYLVAENSKHFDMQKKSVISLRYLVQYTNNISSFRLARNGANAALKAIIKVMCETGILQELNSEDKKQFGNKAIMYAVNDPKSIVAML